VQIALELPERQSIGISPDIVRIAAFGVDFVNEYLGLRFSFPVSFNILASDNRRNTQGRNEH
jgi:hypothetical protein